MFELLDDFNFKEFILNELKTNDFLKGGLTLSIFLSVTGSLFYYFKDVPRKTWDRIRRKFKFTVMIDETDDLYGQMETWFSKHHEAKYRNVMAVISKKFTGKVNRLQADESVEESNPKPKKAILRFIHYEDFFLIRVHGKWLFIRKGREKFENAQDFYSAFYNHFAIYGFFAKKSIEKFLQDVIDYNYSLLEFDESVTVRVHDGYQLFSLRKMDPKPIERVVLPNMKTLIKDVDKFIKDKKWYAERCIPYTRGYLFHGKPGNGKTTLALALANYTKKDMIVIDIGNISDVGLKRAFREIESNSIVLMEDIDAAFDGRESTSKDDKPVSFSTLLNCMDGVFSPENTMFILTTNHPEKLDPALIRKGRIDVQVEITNPSTDLIGEYLSRFYDGPVVLDMPNYDESIPMVDIQEMCMNNRHDLTGAIEAIGKRVSN